MYVIGNVDTINDRNAFSLNFNISSKIMLKKQCRCPVYMSFSSLVSSDLGDKALDLTYFYNQKSKVDNLHSAKFFFEEHFRISNYFFHQTIFIHLIRSDWCRFLLTPDWCRFLLTPFNHDVNILYVRRYPSHVTHV